MKQQDIYKLDYLLYNTSKKNPKLYYLKGFLLVRGYKIKLNKF